MSLTKPNSGDPGYSGATKASTVIGAVVDDINARPISVKQAAYGATGGGSADDSGAIQAADAAAVAAGTAIYFPPGTYRLDSALNPGGAPWLASPGTASLRGGGANTTIVNITSSLNGWHVDGLKFTSASGTTDTGIAASSKYIAGSSFIRCSFVNLAFAANISSTAGWLTNQVIGGTSSNAPWLLKVDNSTGNTAINNNTWFGHNFTGAAQNVPGIEITCTDTTKREASNSFYGCVFQSLDRQGILARYHNWLKVEDCWFEAINGDNTANPRDGSMKLPAIDLVDANGSEITHNYLNNIGSNAEFIGGTIASTAATKVLWVRNNQLASGTPKVDLSQFSEVTYVGTLPTFVGTPTVRPLVLPERFTGARGSLGSAQTLTTAVYATIALDTEQYDVDAVLDSTSTKGRFTIPTGMDGKWRFKIQASFVANATGIRPVRLVKNAATNVAEFTTLANGLGTTASTTVLDTVLTLAAGDTIDPQARQDSGGNLNLGTGTGVTFVEAERLVGQ